MKRRPREQDYEKKFETAFEQYEEWRSAQEEGASNKKKKPKKWEPEKKKSPLLTRWDLILILGGMLVASFVRSCRSGQ